MNKKISPQFLLHAVKAYFHTKVAASQCAVYAASFLDCGKVSVLDQGTLALPFNIWNPSTNATCTLYIKFPSNCLSRLDKRNPEQMTQWLGTSFQGFRASLNLFQNPQTPPTMLALFASEQDASYAFFRLLMWCDVQVDYVDLSLLKTLQDSAQGFYASFQFPSGIMCQFTGESITLTGGSLILPHATAALHGIFSNLEGFKGFSLARQMGKVLDANFLDMQQSLEGFCKLRTLAKAPRPSFVGGFPHSVMPENMYLASEHPSAM